MNKMRNLDCVELLAVSGGNCNCICVEAREEKWRCMQWLSGLFIDCLKAYGKRENQGQGGPSTSDQISGVSRQPLKHEIGIVRDIDACTQACRNRGEFLHSCNIV